MTVRTSGEIAVVGTGTNSGAPMYVSARSVGGIWSPITVVNTAIPQTCSVGSVGGQVQYDPNGFIHAIFRCEGASSAFLGYVTNRTGSWVTQSLDSLNSGNGLVSFNIDPTGKMHVVYTNSTLLVYLTGDSANSTFASPQTIVSTVTSFTSQVIAARGASDVWILVSELSGGAVFLSQYHKDSGGFFNHTSIGSYPTGTVFLSRLYAQ